MGGQPSLEIPSVHTELEQIYAPSSYGNTTHLQYIVFSQLFDFFICYCNYVSVLFLFCYTVFIIFYGAHVNSEALLINK